MSMIELNQDNAGFWSLLHESPRDHCVQGGVKLADDFIDGNVAVHELHALPLRTPDEVTSAYNAGTSRRSARCGHIVTTIVVQRYEVASREAAAVARLVIVEMGAVTEWSGTSGSGPPLFSESASASLQLAHRQGSNRHVTAVARVAQACMERLSDVCSSGSRLVAPTLAIQAKYIVVATVSPHLCHLQESLPILHFAAASAGLQERNCNKPDDYQSRRQLARVLQENQRLRVELAGRGKASSDASATPRQVQQQPSEPREAAELELGSPSPHITKSSQMAAANLRSPRDREKEIRKAITGPPAAQAQRSLGGRDNRTPEHRRRTGTGCMLPR